jgi:hypothetical protein
LVTLLALGGGGGGMADKEVRSLRISVAKRTLDSDGQSGHRATTESNMDVFAPLRSLLDQIMDLAGHFRLPA